MKVQSIGLEMPVNFPAVDYEQIHSVLSKYSDTQTDIWKECAGAWNGIAYRYYFCCDYSQSYTDLIKQNGSSPLPPQRYDQEKAIFGFFINGFSTLECFCYALYALAGLIDKVNFPLNTVKDKRSVDYKGVLLRFEEYYPNEKITINLRDVEDSKEFKDWNGIRNILAHRSTPARHFRLGGDRDGQTDWGSLYLNDEMTICRLKWLTKILTILLADTQEFVEGHL